jgi:hypothetical protein
MPRNVTWSVSQSRNPISSKSCRKAILGNGPDVVLTASKFRTLRFSNWATAVGNSSISLDPRAALKAMIVANEFLETEVCELMQAVSQAYVRGRFKSYNG